MLQTTQGTSHLLSGVWGGGGGGAEGGGGQVHLGGQTFFSCFTGGGSEINNPWSRGRGSYILGIWGCQN